MVSCWVNVISLLLLCAVLMIDLVLVFDFKPLVELREELRDD